ncbi:hypothetical protein EVAR_90279_1 [Eumeta japonica]|uniref:Uncharacterized protein n=1 Tax=Eumeta variegata TaxID=151549 RepID=A0A4C1Z7N6_EUMVA|nr:hypothetical protein EVAR_90279_1 [Eumeta japonica]
MENNPDRFLVIARSRKQVVRPHASRARCDTPISARRSPSSRHLAPINAQVIDSIIKNVSNNICEESKVNRKMSYHFCYEIQNIAVAALLNVKDAHLFEVIQSNIMMKVDEAFKNKQRYHGNSESHRMLLLGIRHMLFLALLSNKLDFASSCTFHANKAHLQEIADSHIHQGARSVKTTNTTSLDRPLSCNGQRATKTLLRQPQITTDRHACQMSQTNHHQHYPRKLRESKRTDLFYHLIRNVSLPFLNHAGAQYSELSAAARSWHEQKEFKGADVRLTAAAVAPPRA